VNAGERDSVCQEGGEKKGSACEEKCESKSNPKPRPKPKPSSADVAERGEASIGVRSSGNLCVDCCLSLHLFIKCSTMYFFTAVPITSLSQYLCVCVYYCRTKYKAVCVGGEGIWEDMCYERRRAEACVD
jgi:hypothetical protein